MKTALHLIKTTKGARYNEAGYVINEITGLPDYDHVVHLGQRCQGVDHLGSQCNPSLGWQGMRVMRWVKTAKAQGFAAIVVRSLIDPNEKLRLSTSTAVNTNPYEWNQADVVRTLINSPNEKGTIRLDPLC